MGHHIEGMHLKKVDNCFEKVTCLWTDHLLIGSICGRAIARGKTGWRVGEELRIKDNKKMDNMDKPC